MKVTESINAFLAVKRGQHNNPRIIDLDASCMEVQVNVAQGEGEPKKGEKGGIYYDDGLNTWWSIRVPKQADSDPTFKNYDLKWPLELHAESIGSTGWNWRDRRSEWVGFDFDALVGHAAGISDADLADVRQAAESLPYVEMRRSTSGNGLHLIVYLDGVSTPNHTAHAGVARSVLAKMSSDTGYDFDASVDCLGGIIWLWSRNAGERGFEPVKEATAKLSVHDLPDAPTTTTTPLSSVTTITLPNDLCTRRDLPLPTYREILAALADLHPRRADDYKQWFKIGGALRSLGDQYFAVWDMWSKQSSNYGDTREVWERLDPNKGNLDTLFRWARADRDGYDELDDEENPFGFRDWDDLMLGESESVFLIEDALAQGEPAIIGGASKTLKTSLCLDACISLATATPFLGKFAVRQKYRVAVFSGESGTRVLRETSQRIARAKGIDPHVVQGCIQWTERLPSLSDPISLKLLARELRKRQIDVVFLDPLYLILGGDDHGNVFKQGERLRQIKDACEGTTPLMLHHNTKASTKSFKPPTLNDLSQAGFSEFAAQYFLLGRRSAYIPRATHELWLQIGGRAGHGSLNHLDVYEGDKRDPGGRVWHVSLKDHYEAVAEQRATKRAVATEQHTDDCDRIREALAGGGLTKNAIHKATGIHKRELDKILPAMEGVVQASVIVKGVSYEGWWLSEQQESVNQSKSV